MIDFARARRTMVDNQVAPVSITDRRLLAAMGRIPRERFVPEGLRDLAYIDRDLPLAEGRVLVAPASFARLIQLAAIAPDEKVLDASCGTGYSTAVLAALGNRVIGLEADAALAKLARETLAAEGVGNATVVGSQQQAAGEAPFDVIVVADVVEVPPPALLALLREGGRLAARVGHGAVPAMEQLHYKHSEALDGGTEVGAPRPAPAHPSRDHGFVF